ncbi:MAG: NYN domain-containing protein [Ignavibacteria bacterium]
MKRIGVFIDLQNIYLAVKTIEQKSKINFAVLKEFLRSPEAVVTMSVFTCYDPEYKSQVDFINHLGLLGYRVVSKPLKKLPDGSTKANMDLEMAMEVMNQAPYLDEIVLITGDGDFTPLVNYLCSLGKFVRIIGPDVLTSPDLIRACHTFTNLNKIDGIFDVNP